MPSEFLAVTAPGLEAITAAELAQLGLQATATEPGAVTFSGDQAALFRANLESRTATRITMRLGQFEARTWFELERHVRKLDWGLVLAPGTALDLEVTSRKSRLYHQKAIAERIVREVAGERREARGERREGRGERGSTADGASGADGPVQRIVVRVIRDRFTISADSSGELLHRRGYRLETARAPMRETLAAAMLLGAGWNGTTPLVDPFTGSGTIPIEAALLARRIPPGLGRRFAFEAWPSHDRSAWQKMVDAARAAVLPGVAVPIAGSDRDAGAVQAARANAERAGVADAIMFRQAALSAIEPGPGPGLLLANPPWGARVSGGTDLRNLYAQLGNVVRHRLPGWRVGLLVADKAMAAQVGIAWEERFGTVSGGVRVWLVVGGW